VQTLKQEQRDSGLHEGISQTRAEWEWPIADSSPDPALLASLPAAKCLPAGTAASLSPVFTTEVQREVALLHPPDGTVIEAALGQGLVRAGAISEPVSELELELKRGGNDGLCHAALDLLAHVPLGLEPESKSERGARLLGSAPVARKPGRLKLAPEMTGAEAFHAIIGHCLAHLGANMTAARTGDEEGVHQIRVAVRRLRAAMVLFRLHLAVAAVEPFETGLRRLGQCFGEVRDWDVLTSETLAAAEREQHDAPWIACLRKAAEAPRAAACVAAAQELASSEVAALLLGLSAWAGDGVQRASVLGSPALEKRLDKILPALLGRLSDKVAKRGRHLRSTDDKRLHRLRKSVKKLRYGAEFTEALFQRKQIRKYLEACKELQESLGAANDATTALALAEKVQAGDAGLTAWCKAREKAALHRLAKDWKHFRKTTTPWD
jgi:inorganic triphosphatase YgiF